MMAPIGVSCSDRFEVEPLTDELRGFGQMRRCQDQGVLDDVHLTANVVGNVEDRRLALVERAYYLEAFDRRIGRLQHLADTMPQAALLLISVSTPRTFDGVSGSRSLSGQLVPGRANLAALGRKPSHMNRTINFSVNGGLTYNSRHARAPGYRCSHEPSG